MSIWTHINELPKDELIDLLYEYDKYLERARELDLFATGWTPVCLAEFYDVEFPIALEDRGMRTGDDQEEREVGYSDECLNGDIHGGLRSAGDY